MNTAEVKEIVQHKYDLEISGIEKVKNVYRIQTLSGDLCLKVIKYELAHFLFIVSAIKHLQKNGFQRIPEMIRSKDGLDYIELKGFHAYLTPWVNARECNYNNPIEIVIAASKLAELHKKSEGFTLPNGLKPRVGWFKWIESFEAKKNTLLDFKKRVYGKEQRTEFDRLYIQIMDDELQRAEATIAHLIESQYLEKMQHEIAKRGFCHHDYAHHNVLIEENGTVDIIDFDYCILDTHLHDLSSLLIRRMKNGKWDMENATFILEAYNVINKVNSIDIPIMAAFMEFPQDYWQVGIQYYYEEQPWGEEFFIRKMLRIYEDREEKQEFIEEFRRLKL